MKYMKNCKWLFASYLLLVPVSTVTSVLFSLGLEPLINVASANDWAHFARMLERIICTGYPGSGCDFTM